MRDWHGVEPALAFRTTSSQAGSADPGASLVEVDSRQDDEPDIALSAALKRARASSRSTTVATLAASCLAFFRQ